MPDTLPTPASAAPAPTPAGAVPAPAEPVEPAGPTIRLRPQDAVSPGVQYLQREADNSFLGRAAAAFGRDNIATGLLSGRSSTAIGRTALGLGFDPDFRLTEENLTAAADRHAIPPHLRAQFFEAADTANSAVHLDELGANFRSALDRSERLQAAGLPAEFGYTALAVLLDPFTLVPGIAAAGPITRFITAGGRATYRGAAARSGLVGGASNVAAEGALTAGGDPTRSVNDLWMAGAAGLALGAPLGALGRLVRGTIPDAPGDADALIRSRQAAESLADGVVLDPELRPTDALVTPTEAGVRARGELTAEISETLSARSAQLLPQGGVAARRAERADLVKEAATLVGDRVDRATVRSLASALKLTRRKAEAQATAQRTGRRDEVAARIAAIDAELEVNARAQQAGDSLDRFLRQGEVPREFRSRFDSRVAELAAPPRLTPLADALRHALGGRPLKTVAREDWGVNVDLDDVDIPQHRAHDAPIRDDSAGAARRTTGSDPLVEDTKILDSAVTYAGDVPEPEFIGRALRFDSMNTLIGSASAKVRSLGAALWPEHIEHNFVQQQTASELQDAIDRSSRIPLKAAAHVEFPRWAAARGVPGWRVNLRMANAAFEEFANEVGTFIRTGGTPPSPEVGRTAAAATSRLADYLERGKRSGVFDDSIPDNPNYLPRIMDESKLLKHWADPRIGEDGVRRLIAEAIRRHSAFLDPDVLEAVARGYVKRIRGASYGVSRSLMYGISLDDTDALRAILSDAGVGAADIQRMVGLVTARNEQLSKLSHAKRRLDLDETASITLSDGSQLRVVDLLENNIDVLFDKYSRRVSGAIALKEKLGIIGSSAERTRLRNEVISELEEHGLSPEQTRRQADVAEAFVRRIAGVPLENTDGLFGNHPLSVGSRLTEGARRFNFATYMVQSGFASVAEFGLVQAKGGLSVLLHGVTHFRSFIRDARTGQLGDDVIQFFEEYIGVGADNLLYPLFSRFDDFTTAAVDERLLSKFERGLNAAQHLVAEKISGLGPLTRWQRRVNMLGTLRQIEGWAIRGKGNLTRGQIARLNQSGISQDELLRVRDGMRAHHITLQSGYRDRSFTRTDLQTWSDDDPELFAKVMNAIGREAHRTIIEGDISAAPLLVNSRIGRLSTQFMTFAINAHTKLLLRGLSVRDAEVAMGALYSTMWAALAYTVQSYVNTVGRPEARERALEPSTIAKRAFARAGYASLVPQAVDMLAPIGGFDKVFDARSTGLPSGAITSIPTVNTLDNMRRIVDTAANVRSDRRFSREQWRAITGTTPVIGRMVGARAAWEYLAEDLPRESVRDRR